MNRKVLSNGTIAAFALAAVLVIAGDATRVVACDEAAKTAKAASASSCSEKSTRSASAAKIHNASIKSAVVAPGAAPVLNAAALGAAVTAGSCCDWCPELTAAVASSACVKGSGAATAAMAACVKDASAVITASAGGACAGEAAVHTAAMKSASGCAEKGAVKTAAAEMASGCAEKGAVKTAAAEMASGCDKSAAAGAKAGSIAAGGDACCASGKTAAAAGTKVDGCKEVCEESKTARAFKASVDDVPYRENKRVVLKGAYACGHCTLQVTEGCAPMFKTADGKVYPLVKNDHASNLRKVDQGKGVEIASSVKKIDGVKYLEVKSFKSL